MKKTLQEVVKQARESGADLKKESLTMKFIYEEDSYVNYYLIISESDQSSLQLNS